MSALQVGKENITDFFGRMACRTGSPNWECWRDSVSKKTGGMWYSTLAQGYCGDGTAPAPAGCTWKVTNVDKVSGRGLDFFWDYVSRTSQRLSAIAC